MQNSSKFSLGFFVFLKWKFGPRYFQKKILGNQRLAGNTTDIYLCRDVATYYVLKDWGFHT